MLLYSCSLDCHARIQDFLSGGVQVSLTKKKALTLFFFCFFLVLSLFYRSQMVNFKEIYHFSRFQRGPTFSRGGGGPTFRGGSNCLFPIETHITCDFPGGVRTPCPPSGSALDCQSKRPSCTCTEKSFFLHQHTEKTTFKPNFSTSFK